MKQIKKMSKLMEELKWYVRQRDKMNRRVLKINERINKLKR